MTFRNTISLLAIFVVCLASPGHTFFDTFMYPCSSAMVCVDITKCDKVGVISENDVTLLKEEELFRSPLVPCRKADGEQGVCCRDPNYKDDWPTDVKFYDDKGKWNPKKTPIQGSDSKTTEIKVCIPPEVKLPNGKCGIKEVIERGSKFDSEVITKAPPTKVPQQYLPPVTERPCPVGTSKDPILGRCVAMTVKEVTTPRPKPPVAKADSGLVTSRDVVVKTTTKAPIVYLPPPSDSQVKPDAECAPNEVKLPNGRCGVLTDTPEEHHCPPGTKKTATGCIATIKIMKPKYEVKKSPTTAKPPIIKPTLPYMPDRTYLPPAPKTQLKADATYTISGGHCSGKIFEENNKRYCCELML